MRAGDTIRVRDAIHALVTKSANDVAVVVAEAVGGSEAKVWPADDRAGPPSRHAKHDVPERFRAAPSPADHDRLRHGDAGAGRAPGLPREYAYFSTASFTWKGRTYHNHNKLLSHYEGTDGIKTGYIGASGFNLVASVQRQGRRLIGVVFGGKSGPLRDRHMKQLLDSGFEKVAEIRVASIVPPLPSPRPERELQMASLAASADNASAVTTDASSLLPPVGETIAETESGSRDEGVEWGIQVGAYSTELRAQRSIALARGHLTEILTGADALVEPMDRRTGRIYRARLLGLSEPEARSACLSLKQKQVPCVPVPGRADLALGSAAGG